MIKTDTDKIDLREIDQDLRLEESILGIQRPKMIAELQEFVGEAEKDEETLDLDQIIHNSDILLGIINEQVNSKRIWQIVTACSTIFVVIISFICLGLYMKHQNHIERLGQVQASVQKADSLEKQLVKSNKELENIQNELTNSKAELKGAQVNLKNSKSEVENLQNQLADTTQRLIALQNRNAAAVKRLSERLQKLPD